MGTFQESKTGQTMQPRQVAYIVQIKDIINSIFVKEDGWNPNYIKVGNKNISRINLIGTVIETKEDGNFQDITLDDGTGNITARNFEKKISANVGDAVLLIGRIRQFGNTKYITPEIIKRNINTKWSVVWKKNAVKNIKSDEEDAILEGKIEIVKENSTNYTEEIISKIKDLDDGTGASYEDIIKNNADEKLISQLLLRGDIFEIKPGKLKVLD